MTTPHNQENPSHHTVQQIADTPPSSVWKLMAMTVGWTSIFFLTFMVISLSIAGFFLYRYLDAFTTTANITLDDLRSYVETGIKSDQYALVDTVTVLLLGIDTVENKPTAPPLTDTIMLVSLDLNSGEIHSLAFPRDLWSEVYKTKINALYAYGIQQYPEQHTRLIEEVVTDITGASIDHIVLLGLDDVSAVIDAIGGVVIDVEVGFVDDEFPREDVDLTNTTDPKLLYRSVSFESGVQKMDGATALTYIRSRKSDDLVQGTDMARNNRQGQIIQALVDQVSDRHILMQPEILGKLYALYQEKFAEIVSVPQAIALAKELYARNNLRLSFYAHQFTVYPDDPSGVITHPKPSRAQDNQWVYVIHDPEAFRQQAQSYLYTNLDYTQ